MRGDYKKVFFIFNKPYLGIITIWSLPQSGGGIDTIRNTHVVITLETLQF